MAKKLRPIAVERLIDTEVIWCDKKQVKDILSIPGIVIISPFENNHMVVRLDKRYSEWELIREIKAVGYV